MDQNESSRGHGSGRPRTSRGIVDRDGAPGRGDATRPSPGGSPRPATCEETVISGAGKAGFDIPRRVNLDGAVPPRGGAFPWLISVPDRPLSAGGVAKRGSSETRDDAIGHDDGMTTPSLPRALMSVSPLVDWLGKREIPPINPTRPGRGGSIRNVHWWLAESG
ncbi:hypothetical protein THAOC_13476 [Thalassiosira oceanica]|uniref:Uncharacterized protein n=1 Tax=Thalassiosira oceanica TaxID=159749 RepID=K0SK20_THAOC|nr:hypothetical protein THAOC_13476 [Thalassiosira oceanica]|eukprot:EJK65645.1 hypothetical protein THAOC_13476 [Thalassiosira oceanica]